VFFSKCFVSNGTCAGTCFIYLRPTAMPVGLAGLNINKIVLRAVLAPGGSYYKINSHYTYFNNYSINFDFSFCSIHFSHNTFQIKHCYHYLKRLILLHQPLIKILLFYYILSLHYHLF